MASAHHPPSQPAGCCLLLRRHYHASLTPEEREAVQAEWTNGDVPIIVATIAFGMGERCWAWREGRARSSIDVWCVVTHCMGRHL